MNENLQIHITINPELYTKNPESTELGKKIVSTSIQMINDLGYEAFTYKKLGVAIGSNESSIYSYFESKHALLVYLINWYWSWIEYKLVFATTNVHLATGKFRNAITLLTEEIKEDNSFNYIDEVLLNKIIISESAKAYHTKNIDKENEKGYFITYERVVQHVSEITPEVNPIFEFPNMLASKSIEGAHHHPFFQNTYLA